MLPYPKLHMSNGCVWITQLLELFLILPIQVSTLNMLVGVIKLLNGRWSQSVLLFLHWSIDWLRGSLHAALAGFELVVILLPLPPWGCNHRSVLPWLASFTLFWTGDVAQQKSCEEEHRRRMSLQLFPGDLTQCARCWKDDIFKEDGCPGNELMTLTGKYT